jgi:hypothetical protein
VNPLRDLTLDPAVAAEIARRRADEDERARAEKLLSDASALERLAQYPEWAVLDRILKDHAKHVARALRQRGLGALETEALRAELDAIEWLRYRPTALKKALEDRDAMLKAQQETVYGRRDPDTFEPA